MSTLLSNPGPNVPQGPRGGQGIVREMQKPFLQGAQEADLAHCTESPREATAELRQAPAHPWQVASDGAGQEGPCWGLCNRPRHKGGSLSMGGGRFGTMGTHRDSLPWGRLSLLLLLLGLALPPATAQVLSYKEAVLHAVEGFNQRSWEGSLYRLLGLDQQLPDGDENPNTPKPVSFKVKETVCPRTTQLPPEQCEFKENGLVKQCTGTVTLNQASGYFDINCAEIQDVGLRRGVRKIWNKVKKVGKRIKDFFLNILPGEAS